MSNLPFDRPVPGPEDVVHGVERCRIGGSLRRVNFSVLANPPSPLAGAGLVAR
jgi:hypothetical protein